ncbi:MAG: resolvase [Arcobacter sp.]|nr:MAG: resolvase [Arcobacter sp.]
MQKTMKKIRGYCRVSTSLQENLNQRLLILDFAHKNSMVVDDIVEVTTSSKKNRKDRQIDSTIDTMTTGDVLLVYALDRIGRSTIETLQILEDIKNKGIKLIIIKENIVIDKENDNPLNTMMLTMLSAVAELERSFISERTKLGLARVKANGTVLGRKKGVLGKSMFDEHLEKIKELHSLGLSLPKIVNHIGIGTSVGLHRFIKTRKI